MTYADSAALAIDAAFTTRVQVAAMEAAIAIMNEASIDGYEVYHSKRTALARRAITDSGSLIAPLSWAVAANGTISAAGLEATDNDIQFVVTSVWDALAEVLPEEKPPA